MECLDYFKITLKNKKKYENYLDRNGYVYEELDNVALGDGCYCKYFSYKRDWGDKSSYNADGFPILQGYCSFINNFLGGFCCGGGCNDFEKGKSARVKTTRDKISKDREKRNIPERGSGLIAYSQKYKKSMSGRDYIRYLNILMESLKATQHGHEYAFRDPNFHKLDEDIRNEIRRVIDILQIDNKEDIEKYVQPHLVDIAERFLLRE